MKLQSAKLILLSAFEHEPETRAEYFKIEAEKSGYNSELFFRELIKAYNQLLKYVNSKDYSLGLCIDDTGSEFYQLKNIEFTNGFIVDNENITDLLKPLHDFGALYVQETETPAPPPQGETTKQKIEKALEPLRKAFEDTGHIDKIIEALAEYAKGTTPDCVENDINYCECSQFLSKDFFEPFKGLNKKIGLTNKQIAEVLRCFIYPFTGSTRKQLLVDSIITSIKGRKSY